MISDIIEVCEKQNIGEHLVTKDIEKAFDYLDHDFLVNVLNRFGSGTNIKVGLSCCLIVSNRVLLMEVILLHTLIQRKVLAEVTQYQLTFLS